MPIWKIYRFLPFQIMSRICCHGTAVMELLSWRSAKHQPKTISSPTNPTLVHNTYYSNSDPHNDLNESIRIKKVTETTLVLDSFHTNGKSAMKPHFRISRKLILDRWKCSWWANSGILFSTWVIKEFLAFWSSFKTLKWQGNASTRGMSIPDLPEKGRRQGLCIWPVKKTG